MKLIVSNAANTVGLVTLDDKDKLDEIGNYDFDLVSEVKEAISSMKVLTDERDFDRVHVSFAKIETTNSNGNKLQFLGMRMMKQRGEGWFIISPLFSVDE